MPHRSPTNLELPVSRSLIRGVARGSSRTNDQVAKLYLEIAQLFVAYGKPHVARRRLKLALDQCADSAIAVESRNLLEALEAGQTAGSTLNTTQV